MAGKKGGRSKKVEPVAVEAADSTNIEETQQNGGVVESVESLKPAAPAKKGRGAKKEVAEAVPVKKVEEKSKAAPKKSGRSKKEEPAANGDVEEDVNGDNEVLKEEPAPVKKGRGKKESIPEPEPEPEVEKPVAAKKGGRSKKGAAATATETLPETVSHSEETEQKIESPSGKKGKKRSAEIPSVAAENGGTEEIIDTKKSKKESKSPEKPSKTAATTSKTTEVGGRGGGRKKKESVEKETTVAAADTNVVTSTPITTETVTAKGGRGRKRKEESAPVIHESVEDITAEDEKQVAVAAVQEPAPKKEKKTKAAGKK